MDTGTGSATGAGAENGTGSGTDSGTNAAERHAWGSGHPHHEPWTRPGGGPQQGQQHSGQPPVTRRDAPEEHASRDDRDMATAASRFAPAWELERIAATRSDLHLVLASNPAIPPAALDHLTRSTDPRVQEALKARHLRHQGPPTPAPTQPPQPGAPQTSFQPTDTPTCTGAPSQPAQAPSHPLEPQQPAQAPTCGRRRRRVTAVAASLVVLLVLGAAAGGWYWLHRDDQAATMTMTGIVPVSDAWAGGAERLWQERLSPGTQVAVVGSRLLALSPRSGGRGGGRVTGYGLSEYRMTEGWTADLPDRDRGSELSFSRTLSWGATTAVYGSTLISTETGKMSAAPWGSGQTASVADSVAVNCDEDDTCTAWDESLNELWSRSIPDSGPDASGPRPEGHTDSTYLPVTHRGEENYVVIAHTVVNVETGEVLPLDDPEGSSAFYSYVTPAQDGWGFVAVDDDYQLTVTTYTARGDKIESFSAAATPDITPASYWDRMSTLESIRSDMQDPTSPSSGVTTTQKDFCTEEVTVGNGTSFPVPTSKAGQEESCASNSLLFGQGRVLVLYSSDYLFNPTNTFLSLMDLTTGKEILFPDAPEEGVTLYTGVTSDLVIGYSPSEGTLTAYAPTT